MDSPEFRFSVTRLLSILFCLGFLGGCSFPKHMTGQFTAQGGDFIVIHKDGALYWSPPGNTVDQRSFVGIGSPDSRDPQILHLVVPSTSPFLYSSLKFSPDYSRLTVDWGRSQWVKDAIADRSTEFQK